MTALRDLVDALPRGKYGRGPKPVVLRASLIDHDLTADECWPWRGSLRNGYGAIRVPVTRRSMPAHRFVWELVNGPTPTGHQIDHLCHDPLMCNAGNECPHRSCVNPRHLAAVTLGENVLRSNGPPAINARKTHCKRGHEFTPENTYIKPSTGYRNCRECAGSGA